MTPAHKCIHEEELGRIAESDERNTRNIDELFKRTDQHAVESAIAKRNDNIVFGFAVSVPGIIACILQGVYIWVTMHK